MGNTGGVRRLLPGIVVIAFALAAAGCGSSGGSGSGATGSTASVTTTPTAAASRAAKAKGREWVTLAVPAKMRGGELSSPHKLSVPSGWTASVWARPDGARMEAITTPSTAKPKGGAKRSAR